MGNWHGAKEYGAACQNPYSFITMGSKCGNGQMIHLIIIAEVQVFQPLHCLC